MDAIMERVSVRQYKEEKIPQEKIEMILKAGMAAPSAVNKQPWELIVVEQKDRLKELAHFSPYAQALKQAACAIIVCADKTRSLETGYDVQDLAALSENMLIKAKELGIGGVWLGGYPEKDRIAWLKRFFDLPAKIEPYWVLSFGIPIHAQKPMDKWDPKKIHYEQY